MKYIRKPNELEAFYWDGLIEGKDLTFFQGRQVTFQPLRGMLPPGKLYTLHISVIENGFGFTRTFFPDTYIIKDSKNDKMNFTFRAFDKKSFETLYEPV